MTVVHIESKWCIRNDDMEQLLGMGLESKSFWWFKKLPNEWHTNMLGETRIPGNQKLSVDMDLDDGEYQAGCGSTTTVSEKTGRGIYQKLTFYIKDGVVHYCNWSDLPSNNGGVAPLDTAPTGAGVTAVPATQTSTAYLGGVTAPAPKSAEEKFFIISGHCYCKENMEIVNSEDTCNSFEYNIPSDKGVCSNCTKALMLYVKRD